MKCPKCGYNSFEFHDTCKKCANDLTRYKETFGIKTIVLSPEARTSLAESFRPESTESDQATEVPETARDMFTFDIPEGESETPAAAAVTNDNPFNFDEEPHDSQSQDFGNFSFDESTPSKPQEPGAFSFDEPASAKPGEQDDFSLEEPAETQSQDFGEFSFDEPSATQSQGIGDFSFDEGDGKPAQAKTEEDAFASLLDSSSKGGDADAQATAAPQESAFTSDSAEFSLDSFSWEDTPAAPTETETKPDDNLSSIFDDTDDSTKK